VAQLGSQSWGPLPDHPGSPVTMTVPSPVVQPARRPLPTDRVRLGVLGAGNIADLNVAGFLDHPQCDVVAVCDSDPELAAAAARRWGAPKVCTDLEELLTDDEVDAVEVLTPTHHHHAHVLAALRAGKHVSVQKPVSNTVAEARELAWVAAEAGLVLRVSECFRHYPPLERARELVVNGAIGRLTGVRIKTVVGLTDSEFQAGLRPEGYGWRLDGRSPGGHLFDDMVHKYAMALWLPGLDVVSVQAVVRRRDFFYEPCVALFEYDDPEVLGVMDVHYAPKMWLRSRYYGADEVFELQGEEGVLWVTRATGEMLDAPPVVVYQGRDNVCRTITEDVEADWGEGFRRSSAHFVDSLLDGAVPAMTPDEAVRVLQLCFAVYRASTTRLPVDPRTISDPVIADGWPSGDRLPPDPAVTVG
jgi:predicted dehydrogenase